MEVTTDAETRILDLIKIAAEERIPYSTASLRALREFLEAITFEKRPSIYLLENGNFRAIFRNDKNEQLSLQFRADNTIHCVTMMRLDGPHGPLTAHTCVCSFKSVVFMASSWLKQRLV